MQAYSARKPSPNAQGLSIAHKTTGWKLTTAKKAKLVRLQSYGGPQLAKNPGKRGVIKGFSRGSRGRLQRKLSSVPQGQFDWLPWMVTLTYPGEYSGDWHAWKRDLAAFREALKRKVGRCALFWRMELQVRGAPHFHLIIFTPRDIPKDWLSNTWFRIVGSGDARHLRVGTQVERLRTWKGGASYAAKYVGKMQTGVTDAMGRVWGVWNQKLLGILMHVDLLDIHVADRIRRIMRSLLHKNCPKRTWPDDQRAGIWSFMSEEEAIAMLKNASERTPMPKTRSQQYIETHGLQRSKPAFDPLIAMRGDGR